MTDSLPLPFDQQEAMANPYRSDPPNDFDPVDSLDREAAAEQVEQLVDALDFHDQRYYRDNDPVISDHAYDRLFQRLVDLEAAYPELQKPNSPTRRVGAEPVDELEEIEHTAPMLSLDAAFDREEIEKFEDFCRRNAKKPSMTAASTTDFNYFAEPKFDGLSAEVVFENGDFVRAATRGNGTVGEDITRNVRTIRTLPMRLSAEDPPELLAVRAEILMPRSGFQEMNKRRIERGDDPFANPRNAAAGTVRQLDPSVVARRPLDIYFYDILRVDGAEFSSQTEVRQALDTWGLKLDDHTTYCETVDEIEDFYRSIDAQREELDFEIDGVVIKIDEFDVRQVLGERSRSPRWAIAWKFDPKQEVTILRDIAVQVGRTGKLTPVAMLDPVEVGGVTVSRASLHNIEELHGKDVRKGDTVRIQRAGDVIPEVVELVEPAEPRAEPFEMPDRCPVCGTETVREGPLDFCPNGISCTAQLKGHLIHYASRNAMDIDGLGEETVNDLIDAEMVEDIADLYELEPADFQSLEGFAETSANNLYESIQGSRTAPLDRFLFALGIRHVGSHVARLIAEAFGTLDAVRRAEVDDLQETKGIGPEIAQSLHEFFDSPGNNAVVDRLLELGVEVEPVGGADDEGARPLEGLTFVFTGSLDEFTRSEAQRRVEELGARATSSVSGNTDYLVAGDNPGSKYDEAQDRGVDILDEEAFLALLDR
jgi:DNA ligase (NAD+)